MHLNPDILGKHACDVLKDRQTAAVLVIGNDIFTRKDLAAVSCFNFTAAAILSRVLSKDLHVKDTKDVFQRVHPRALALPGLGHISFATLGAAFEKKRLGTLSDYYDRHLKDDATSFGVLKTQVKTQRETHTSRRGHRPAPRLVNGIQASAQNG